MDEHKQANETDLHMLSFLKGVMDPELGINIIDLGLIYEISFSAAGRIATRGVDGRTIGGAAPDRHDKEEDQASAHLVPVITRGTPAFVTVVSRK